MPPGMIIPPVPRPRTERPGGYNTPQDILGGIRGWVDPRRNFLMSFGAGLASGDNFGEGVAAGLQNAVAYGKPADDAYATQQKEEAKRQEELNKTIAYLRQNRPDLAKLVDAGMPVTEAWSQLLAKPKAPIEVNGQLVDPSTYQVLGDYRTPTTDEAAKPPTGYRWSPSGALEFIPGGPADPAAQAANKGDTEQTRRAKQLASMVNPQLQIAIDNFDAMADLGNQAGNAAGLGTGAMTSPQYQQARNAVYTIAQSYLYSVSGAAAPAEEVNKLVASVTPVPFESPQSIADKKERLKQMVEAINLMATGGAAQPTTPSGQTSTGVPWTLESDL
jgi:hypothetical protein